MAFGTCAHCGADLKGKRFDADYCSGKCRVAAHRRRKATMTIPGMEAPDLEPLPKRRQSAIRKGDRSHRKGRK
jgi:hypothetical protein